MTTTNLTICVGEIADNVWVAATTRSPYFCFEGRTENEVLGIARRALQFYSELEHDSDSSREKGRAKTDSTLRTAKKVSAEELESA